MLQSCTATLLQLSPARGRVHLNKAQGDIRDCPVAGCLYDYQVAVFNIVPDSSSASVELHMPFQVVNVTT
jgi:hypothetical protein